MTVNEQQKKVLSNTLALSSSGLAVTSVMAGYFLQTQWGMESLLGVAPYHNSSGAAFVRRIDVASNRAEADRASIFQSDRV